MERPNRDEVRIKPRGELDLTAADRLEECLDQALPSAHRITVDLRGLTFMDCAGLSVLLDAHVRAPLYGVGFALIRGPRQIDRLLSAIGVDRAFEFTADDTGRPERAIRASASTPVQRAPFRLSGNWERENATVQMSRRAGTRRPAA